MGGFLEIINVVNFFQTTSQGYIELPQNNWAQYVQSFCLIYRVQTKPAIKGLDLKIKKKMTKKNLIEKEPQSR